MPIDLVRREEFALLTLNRPDALNALNRDLVRELGARVDEAGASGARALLITGAGERAFCAGADIGELALGLPVAARASAELGQRTFAKLDRLAIPSVAIIDGYAFGGGLELAMACTFRVATARAKMGQPEIKIGLIPGYGGTQRLPRLVGEAAALDLVMTGRTVDAEEALRLGLVNRLVGGEPIEAGIAFAREFSGHSLAVLRFAREAIQRGAAAALDDGLRIEADLSALAKQTADAEEGRAAFLDKRAPVFKDR